MALRKSREPSVWVPDCRASTAASDISRVRRACFIRWGTSTREPFTW